MWEHRPVLPESIRWMYHAYWELQTCRPVGLDVGPIPWWAISLYAQRMGRSFDEEQLLVRVVRRMAKVHKEWLDAEADRKAAAATPTEEVTP